MRRLRIMFGAIATTFAVIFSAGIVAPLAQEAADPLRSCLASCIIGGSGDPTKDWQAHTACVQARKCFAGPSPLSEAVPRKLAWSPASRSRSTRTAATAVAKNRDAEPVQKQAKDCSVYSTGKQAWVRAVCNPGPPIDSPPLKPSPSASAEAAPQQLEPPPLASPQRSPLPPLSPTNSQPPSSQPPTNPEQSPHPP